MKNLIFTLVLFALTAMTIDLNAQITTPAPSPQSTVMQTVGLTDVTIEYSRPSMKGRTLFSADGLVPFGKVWRTGANAATKITFSEDVTVEGEALEAGSYALFTTPGATSWAVHFFPHTTNSSGGYGDAAAALVVNVTPEKLPFELETFLITFDELKSDSGLLELIWGDTVVPVKVGVHSNKQAMASIEKTLAGPTDNDFYAAGVYMASQGQDLDKALSYIQKRTHGEKPGFWQVKNEAEVLAQMGKYKKAIETAEKSLSMAQTAGNMDYVKINKDNIAKWAKKAM